MVKTSFIRHPRRFGLVPIARLRLFVQRHIVGIWFTALKVIPWAEVIAAAPAITKGARKLFKRVEEAAPVPPVAEFTAPSAPLAAAAPVPGATLAQVKALEQALRQVREQQQAAAALVDSLAAQNGRIVDAIDVLRMRVRLLAWASAVLAVGLCGALGWMAWGLAR